MGRSKSKNRRAPQAGTPPAKQAQARARGSRLASGAAGVGTLPTAMTQGLGPVRQSQPANYLPGGIPIIPRRNVANPNMLASNWALQRFAVGSPLRLLAMLADIDPDVSLALDNLVTLTCNAGDVQIVAVPPGEGDHAPDPKGTAALESLFAGLPPEIGGLCGLQAQGTILTACAGFTTLEAVPGAAGQGVRRLWPVEPFSLTLLREEADADVTVAQRQINANIPPEETPPGLTGYRRMNPETFFWGAWQPFVDDPYGRAMFAPALAEVLAYLAMIQDLRDAVKHAAWPRLKLGFNWSETLRMATELLKMKEPQASEWVKARYDEVVAAAGAMKADDAIVTDTNGTSDVQDGGNFSGIEPIIKELRSRIIRACKQLPVMMAFNDAGSTEGHTGVQWQVYAKRLEALRAFVLAPILKAANLHLRLLGLNLVAVAKYEKIRTTDALVDAQTEETKQRTAAKYVLLGWKSNAQAAMESTGSVPAANPEGDREALLIVAGAKPAVSGNPQTGGGTTQQEADAQKGAGNP